MAREDFRQRLTNRLIESLEQNGCFPWNQNGDVSLTRPFNPCINTVFKGGNAINLMIGALEKGFDDPRWMKLDQANALGYRVRKGARAVYAEYWDWEKTSSGNSVPRISYAPLFNASDIVGIPELIRRPEWTPEALARTLIEETGVRIEHQLVDKSSVRKGCYEAYFSNSENKIVVPTLESFPSGSHYYVEVIHQVASWAGYTSGLFNDVPEKELPEVQAKRKLRTELATAFLISRIPLYGTVKTEESAIPEYIKLLKTDKHEIFRAARDAEKIVETVLEFSHELRSRIDARVEDNQLIKPQIELFSSTQENIEENSSAQNLPLLNDARWITFDSTVRREAEKFGIEIGTIEKALSLVEPNFLQVMEAAGKNGYSPDDMNSILVRSLVDEMQTINERQMKWNKFCEQVVNVNTRELGLPSETVQLALQELGYRYQSLLVQSSQNGWAKEQTDQAIRTMVYGDEGRRPVDKNFVEALIKTGRSVEKVPISMNNEEFFLRPLGIGMETDFMPDNSVGLGV